MVILKRLEAQNFKNLKLDMSFPEGVTLIEGLNEAGKSSIIDAILYALYGRPVKPQAGRNEDLIAYGMERASVSLDFSVGDEVYRVVRTIQRRGASKAMLYRVDPGGGVGEVAAGQKNVTERVVELLGGITYWEILSTTVVAQNELGRLLEMDRDDRTRIVNVFLNLQGFNRVIEELDEERRNIIGSPKRRGLLEIEREELANLERMQREYLEEKDRERMLLEEMSSLERRRGEMEAELAEVSRLHSLLTQYDMKAGKRESLLMRAGQIRDKMAFLQSQIDQLSAELAQVDEKLSMLRVVDSTDGLLDDFQKRLERAMDISSRIDELHVLGRRYDEEAAALENTVKPQTMTGRPALKITILGVASLITSLIAFILSQPYLGVGLAAAGILLIGLGIRRLVRDMNAVSIRDRVAEARRLAGGVAHQAEEMNAALKATMEELAGTAGRVFPELLKERLTIEGCKRILERWRSMLSDLERLRAMRSRVLEQLSRLPTDAEIRNMAEDAGNLEREAAKISIPQLPPGVVFSRELLGEIDARREGLVRSLGEVNEALRRCGMELDGIRAFLMERGDVVEKLEKKRMDVERLERRLQILNISLQALKDTAENLRAKVKPAVQEYLASIMPVFTDGRYRAALLDEDFNLHVWDPDAGQYRVKDVFSGGTEDQFLLALRLAFALALIPEVKNVKPEFLFLDEPLASSDERRRAAILDYVRHTLSRRFRQVFIISHLPSLEEYVDNVLRLEDGRLV